MSSRPYVDFLRWQLLEVLGETGGVRVSHRNKFFWFDEKSATLLLSQITDDQSGFAVGERIMIDGNRLSPWLPLTVSVGHIDVATIYDAGARNEAWYDSVKFSKEGYGGRMLDSRVFQIIAFFRIGGKVGKNPIEAIFCALADCGSGLNEPVICRGQEVGRDVGKVNLYWVGCLEKLKKPEVVDTP